MNIKWFFENDIYVQKIVKDKLNKVVGFGILYGGIEKE